MALWPTGKPPALGGIPHDVYGMTTLGVHTFKLGLLQALGKREEEMTKVQTGGPDGDLGSNEIKISKDRTIAVVDGSGVAYGGGAVFFFWLCAIVWPFATLSLSLLRANFLMIYHQV